MTPGSAGVHWLALAAAREGGHGVHGKAGLVPGLGLDGARAGRRCLPREPCCNAVTKP